MTRLLTFFLTGLAIAGLVAAPAPAAKKRSHKRPAPKAKKIVAKRPVPQGFVGVNVDGPMLSDATGLADREYGQMVAGGIETTRIVFFWSRMQPYRTVADVPLAQRRRFRSIVGGVPTDFSEMDRAVASASRRGLPVLPVLVRAPDWAAWNPQSNAPIPRDVRSYTRFLEAVVKRYGPKGRFWKENRGLRARPLREWEVWNEPNISLYWPQPFDSGPATDPSGAPVPAGPQRDRLTYPYLLRASYRAIKRADRGAKVVLAALTNFSWESLGFIYDSFARKGGRYFDAVAVQTYTWEPRNIITALRNVRRVMNRRGDRRKPIYWTELNWPAACRAYDCEPSRGGKRSDQLTRNIYGVETTDAGSAQKLDEAMRLLVRDRAKLGLTRVYVYTWLSRYKSPEDPFDYSGLRALGDGRVADKPSLVALRRRALALEGCKSGVKASVTRCR